VDSKPAFGSAHSSNVPPSTILFMKIKLTFLLASALLLPALGFGIGLYYPGDQLYVLAPSGLILRKTPDPQGERIATLALGDALTAQKENFKKKPHVVEEFKGFKIKGFWVKVRTAGGQEGYVFDGYLSKLHAPTTLGNDPEDNSSIIELYLLNHTQKKGKRIDLPKGDTRYERYRQLFKDGSEAELDSGEGGSMQKITFAQGATLEEGYLIGKSLWLKDMKAKPSISKGKITATSDDELFQITVENRGSIIVLSMAHAD
jgi:hypothetical protein